MTKINISHLGSHSYYLISFNLNVYKNLDFEQIYENDIPHLDWDTNVHYQGDGKRAVLTKKDKNS